jgi:hypothetical protein
MHVVVMGTVLVYHWWEQYLMYHWWDGTHCTNGGDNTCFLHQQGCFREGHQFSPLEVGWKGTAVYDAPELGTWEVCTASPTPAWLHRLVADQLPAAVGAGGPGGGHGEKRAAVLVEALLPRLSWMSRLVDMDITEDAHDALVSVSASVRLLFGAGWKVILS